MSLKSHDLIDKIRSFNILFSGFNWPTDKDKLVEVADDIAKAQKFDMGLVDSIEFDYENEPLEGNQPYPYFYFELDIYMHHDFIDSTKQYDKKRIAFLSIQEGDYFSILIFAIYPDKALMEGVLAVAQGDTNVSQGLGNKELLSTYFGAFKKVIALFNCSNITTKIIEAPLKLNKKRIKKSKSPIQDYKIITIKWGEKAKYLNSDKNTLERQSPRLHLRRGHVRKLADDTMTWVQASVVGSDENGVINKDYKVVFDF